jgi:hypothetical protein
MTSVQAQGKPIHKDLSVRRVLQARLHHFALLQPETTVRLFSHCLFFQHCSLHLLSFLHLDFCDHPETSFLNIFRVHTKRCAHLSSIRLARIVISHNVYHDAIIAVSRRAVLPSSTFDRACDMDTGGIQSRRKQQQPSTTRPCNMRRRHISILLRWRNALGLLLLSRVHLSGSEYQCSGSGRNMLSSRSRLFADQPNILRYESAEHDSHAATCRSTAETQDLRDCLLSDGIQLPG